MGVGAARFTRPMLKRRRRFVGIRPRRTRFVPLALHRAETAKRRMLPLSVIEDLDVIEYLMLRVCVAQYSPSSFLCGTLSRMTSTVIRLSAQGTTL
jgi:hypothetical protein